MTQRRLGALLGGLVGVITLTSAAAASAPAAGRRTASSALSSCCIPSLAFVKSGRSGDVVWTADFAGGHAHRLGPGDQPLVSPSGGAVAASRGGKGAALVIYGPGAGVHTYFKTSRVGVQAVAWSSDSRDVAVELFGNNPGKHDHDSGLAIVDTQTNKAKVIARGAICGASFSPVQPVRLVYGAGPAGSFCLNARVDVFAANPDGSGRHRVTHDGRSLNPVWGPTQIAFDRARPRRQDAPVFQVWLMNPDGSHRTPVTHMRVPTLLDGLVPLQFSADGARLLARYEGQDTDEAWTIKLAGARLRQLKIKGQTVTPGGLSQDGSTVLVDYNGFLNPPSAGTVETLAFGGGAASVIVRHAGFPNWNR